MKFLDVHDQSLPIFAFSFSSKGFPDLVNIAKFTLPHLPEAFLMSLHDLKKYPELLSLIPKDDSRIRIWDSGGYEVSQFEDVSAPIISDPSDATWKEDLYVETANQLDLGQNDILVSFDRSNEVLSVDEQIVKSLELFDQIQGDYFRNLLIHVPEEMTPHELVNIVKEYSGEFHILGLTEKEIAPTWTVGVKFTKQLIEVLNNAELGEMPIHLFGCFDPKSLIYFTLTGVKIFDGLTWLRYFIKDQNTLYKREFEFSTNPEEIKDADQVRASVLMNNMSELNRLRSNLKYRLEVDDDEIFASYENDLELITGGD